MGILHFLEIINQNKPVLGDLGALPVEEVLPACPYSCQLCAHLPQCQRLSLPSLQLLYPQIGQTLPVTGEVSAEVLPLLPELVLPGVAVGAGAILVSL